MRALVLLVLLVCLSVGCVAQRPRPCTSPPLLTGSLSVSTQNEKLGAFAKYTYDALGQRIRLREFGSYNNKTFHLDVLLLYREGVMYKINYRNQTCCKKRLNRCFHPLAIPHNASLLGQAVLGSSSGPGQGVLVNTWTGQLQMRNKTASSTTCWGCLILNSSSHRISVTTPSWKKRKGKSQPPSTACSRRFL
ncbi:ependymin-like isoform X2 [Poecilia latipinna]|uniref:ependymin-like isoform X2 n=1 Tax=Poecilia latipinna TaxID=48699 RepID=UPI00072E02B4|nr:PREDICTED: ependymin-like isoform X2 [Poecilia latipinna]